MAVEELKSLSPPAPHLYRVQEAASIKMPYTVIGIVLLLLAMLIATSKLLAIENAHTVPRRSTRFGLEHPDGSTNTLIRRYRELKE